MKNVKKPQFNRSYWKRTTAVERILSRGQDVGRTQSKTSNSSRTSHSSKRTWSQTSNIVWLSEWKVLLTRLPSMIPNPASLSLLFLFEWIYSLYNKWPKVAPWLRRSSSNTVPAFFIWFRCCHFDWWCCYFFYFFGKVRGQQVRVHHKSICIVYFVRHT